MNKLKVPQSVKILLLSLATSWEGHVDEPLSGEEWEAVCTLVGLQLAFRGQLPQNVARDVQKTMADAALRTGLPLHIVSSEGIPGGN